MGDTLPSPFPRPHLALLATWALSHEERRQFVRAYRHREHLARRMRDLADWIVNRAEALTIQEHPSLRGPIWTEAQTTSFNRWLERLMMVEDARVRELTTQHNVMRARVDDLARTARFRSAEHLAIVLMLDHPVLDGVANER